MAKITQFDEILSSNLDPTDLFYIVDHDDSAGTNFSRKITYGNLVKDLDNRVGTQFFKDASISANSILVLKFELKNGSEKTLTVDLSGLVDFYEGDNVAISVKNEDRTIHLIANYLSAVNGYGVVVLDDGKLSVNTDYKDTTYTNGKGLGLSGSNNEFYISENYLSSNALENYKTYSQTTTSLSNDGYALTSQIKNYSAGNGIFISGNTISVKTGLNIGFDSNGNLTSSGGSGGGITLDYVIQELSNYGYAVKTAFKDWEEIK